VIGVLAGLMGMLIARYSLGVWLPHVGVMSFLVFLATCFIRDPSRRD
jgi:hypothetical protein